MLQKNFSYRKEFMTVDNFEEKFIEKLNKGDVFFLAGSGISYASNLPSASMILEHTLDAFLPKSRHTKRRRNLLKKIQPEIVYEVLLHMTSRLDCLELWKSLHPVEQQKHGVVCKPSFMHHFIVKYSSDKKVPIITTNFDLMFEEACKNFNISYDIYLPDSLPPQDFNKLAICKIHGSIGNEKEIKLNSLSTTMTEITKIRFDWLNFIYSLMEEKCLCIVGYSGRDIDIFPFIAKRNLELIERYKESKIVWINKFTNDYSDFASKKSKSIRIFSWPSDYFKSKHLKLNIKFPSIPEDNIHQNSLSVSELLSKLKLKLSRKNLLTDDEKELFYCVLLHKLGYHFEAYNLIQELKNKKDLKFHNEGNKYFLMISFAKLSHEVADFHSLKESASQLKKILKSERKFFVDYYIIANCLIAESYRMSFASDIYFPKNKNKKYFQNIKKIIRLFKIVDNISKKYDLQNSSIYVKQELLEHKIRFLAFIQSSLSIFDKIIKEELLEKWDKIKILCNKEGYADGIANCEKYKFRLSHSAESKDESMRIYNLLTSATGKELIIRNEAEKLLSEKKYEKSKNKFMKLTNYAKKSGNILNEIKGLLGYAYVNYLTKNYPLLESQQITRLIELKDKVTSKELKKYLGYVIDKYINKEDFNEDSHFDRINNMIDILLENFDYDNLIDKMFNYQ